MMASLKRYKQSSENCSNRSQDIPPRFKRQKSLTSPKHQAAMESVIQNSLPVQKNKRNVIGEHSSSSPAWSSSHQKGSAFPREGRKIVKKLSPQKTQLNVERDATKFHSQPYVLSPMENKLFNLTRNDENCESSNFSSCVNNNSTGIDNMLGLGTVSSVNRQSPNSNVSTTNSDIQNTLTVPLPSNLHGWHGPNSNHECNSQMHPVFSQTQNVRSNNSLVMAGESKIDYSDPDIRTIEMLRELERVADQTDVGNEENANDKNSLVSHHLRMLMCAVDRYTQGVDEASDSENTPSEILPQVNQESPDPSPAPNSYPSVYQYHMIPPNYGSTDYSFEHDQSHCSPNSVPSSSLVPSHSPFSQERKLNTWNPWATPSFNALDVYASPPTIQDSASLGDHSSMLFFDPNNSFYVRDACY